MTTQTTTNRKATTIKGMQEQIKVLSQELNMTASTAANNVKAEWSSKPKKDAVSAVLDYMASTYVKRKDKITKIQALGGKANMHQTTKELTNLLSELTAEKEAKEEKALNTKKASTKKKAVSKEEQARRIAKTVAYINQQMGMEIVTIDTPLSELKKMYDRVKAAKPTVKKEQKSYSAEQVAEAIKQTREQVTAEVTETVAQQYEAQAEVAPTIEAPSTEVPAKLTEEERKALIQECETEMARLQELKKTYALDDDKFYKIVDAYRFVEEKLTVLKGKDVKKLIAEKYKGVSRSASLKLLNAADLTDHYGHAGVNKTADFLISVFTGLIDLSANILHTGVDLTSGTMRMTAKIIDSKKN